MLYFCYRVDKPGTSELRMATRPAHMEYAEAIGDTLYFAGPAMDDDGAMCASVWVTEARDRQHAEDVLSADPDEQVGLFETRIIRRFVKTAGTG